jgi:hypothetical protein
MFYVFILNQFDNEDAKTAEKKAPHSNVYLLEGIENWKYIGESKESAYLFVGRKVLPVVGIIDVTCCYTIRVIV